MIWYCWHFLLPFQTSHELNATPPTFTSSQFVLPKISHLYNFIHTHGIWCHEFGQCQKQENFSNVGNKPVSEVLNKAAYPPFSVVVFGSVTCNIAGQKACCILFTKGNIMAGSRTSNIPIALLNKVSVDAILGAIVTTASKTKPQPYKIPCFVQRQSPIYELALTFHPL